MSVNPGELYPVGQVLFTTRGIAEIDSYYTENDLDKVRFRLHKVNADDGVTPNGESLLMSTIPEKLKEWVERFPKDLEDRRRGVVSKEILARIDEAKANGPVISRKKE